MTACDFSEVTLLAWLDGEAGSRAFNVQTHLEECETCQGRLESVRRARRVLRELVDTAVGEVEPLLALQEIRRRIGQIESRSVIARAQAWSRDMWQFNRRGLAGMALAAALGALIAPSAVLWVGPKLAAAAIYEPGASGVIVESLEVQDNAKAVVVQGDRSTTLIWVESADAPSSALKESRGHEANTEGAVIRTP